MPRTESDPRRRIDDSRRRRHSGAACWHVRKTRLGRNTGSPRSCRSRQGNRVRSCRRRRLRRPRRGRSHSGCRHGLAQVGGSRVGTRRCSRLLRYGSRLRSLLQTGHRQTRSWLRTGRRRILRTAKQRTRCRADRLAEDAPTLRKVKVGLGRDLLAFRIGRPHQVIRVGLLGQGGVDEVLRLVKLQLGQDGDQAATEHGRDLREEREELLVGGVLQRILKAGREHRSTTRGIL